jgi:hypothetical protein
VRKPQHGKSNDTAQVDHDEQPVTIYGRAALLFDQVGSRHSQEPELSLQLLDGGEVHAGYSTQNGAAGEKWMHPLLQAGPATMSEP